MNCPECGAIVLKSDPVCKKCGKILNEAREVPAGKVVYRSRFMLLFRAWLGAGNGMHYKWLGYDEAARQIKAEYGWGRLTETIFTAIIHPMAWFDVFGIVMYQCIECTKIFFGAYRTDANGNPVRYFRPRRKK